MQRQIRFFFLVSQVLIITYQEKFCVNFAQFFYTQAHNEDNFKRSFGRLAKFKNKYGLQQLSITGEK